MTNQVEVHRRTVTDHFTILTNQLIRNQIPTKLTSVGFHLLAVLLSFPKGWKTSRDEIANRFFTEGRDQVAKALTELEDAGYLVRKRRRNPGGQFGGWVWEVSDEPMSHGDEPKSHEPVDNEESAGHTTDWKPDSGQVPPTEELPGHTTDWKPGTGKPGSGFSVTGSSLIEELPPPPERTWEAEAEVPPAEQDRFAEQARAVIAALPAPWVIGRKSMPEAIRLIAAELRGDHGAVWTVDALIRELRSRPVPDQIHRPLGLLRSRLEDLPAYPANRTSPAAPSLPWCGKCERADYRFLMDAEDRPIKCKACHPSFAPDSGANHPQIATETPTAPDATGSTPEHHAKAQAGREAACTALGWPFSKWDAANQSVMLDVSQRMATNGATVTAISDAIIAAVTGQAPPPRQVTPLDMGNVFGSVI